jgi:hypothetical protein
MTGSGIGTIATGVVITNGYSTVADLETRLGITAGSASSEMASIMESASRMIDHYTNRRFYTTDADEINYFTPYSYDLCKISDLISVTSIKTDEDIDGVYETTWTSNDFNLLPYNQTPKHYIETTPYGNFSFLAKLKRSVQVVGRFGYCTLANCPLDIKQAALLEASRLWKRRDAILGISGTTMFGQLKLVGDMDPSVRELIRPYVRYT